MLNKELFYETIKPFEINIDEAAFARLDKFAELLIETNKSFNLTAIKEPDDVTVKHFADCLAIFKYVNIPENVKIIDVGTGAGFPGMVLAIARPDVSVTLLDSLNKRITFLNDVIEKTGIKNAVAVHSRAEEGGRQEQYREKFDFATARAVAPLNVLSEYCLPYVKKGGSFVALKGPAAEEEIQLAKKAVSLLGGGEIEFFSLELADYGARTIIKIKKISQTSAKYPRNSGKIAKQPL